MNGVYLKYIDVPPDIKEALDDYSITHLNPSISTISLANLKTFQPAQTNYATFESNYWKLDGTYRGLVDKPRRVNGILRTRLLQRLDNPMVSR